MRLRTGIALVVVWGAPGVGFADTWVVPDDYVTIQGAIDASADGDAILVRPGTYVENLLIVGKSLSLKSLGGPAATVIDGRYPTRPDTLSVVCALGAESFLLQGFTVSNGSGGSTFPDLEPHSGAGILLAAVGGAIRTCVIEDNFCEGPGGGIYIIGGAVLVEDCGIRDNRCLDAAGGLKVSLSSSFRLERCTIERNEGRAEGALAVALTPTEIVDCIFRGNITHEDRVIRADGSTVIRGTLIVDNGDAGSEQTGCVLAERIESCTIVRNRNVIAVNARVLSRSIVAMNSGRAFSCLPDRSIECCDVFGNGAGDDLCGTDANGNFSLDPLLCADDSIASESPCAPANSPAGCGLIGARGIGCGAAVEPATWGRIKHRWR